VGTKSTAYITWSVSIRNLKRVRSSNAIPNSGTTSLTLSFSMALQFFRPWPVFFKILNPIHCRQDSLDGGSARRKAPTYTQITNTE
jgi:hypothetical protein